MGKKYIRVKKDGFIYEWNEILAANPSCEVIEEEEVLPPPEVAKEVVAKRKPKKTGLTLGTDIPESPPYTAPELAADAGRKLPK